MSAAIWTGSFTLFELSLNLQRGMGDVRQHAGGVAEREAQEAKERGGDVVADARGPPLRQRAPLQGLPLPSNETLQYESSPPSFWWTAGPLLLFAVVFALAAVALVMAHSHSRPVFRPGV